MISFAGAQTVGPKTAELSTATMKALAQGTLGNEGASESRATPAAALSATPSPLPE